MIIVTTPDITPDALERIIAPVEAAGLRIHVSCGERRTIVGGIGDDGILSEHGLRTVNSRSRSRRSRG
jgi:3-deoxy-7-phosphoheptulonate synthase